MEDGVDAVGEHGERILGGEEPDKGHDCSEVSKASRDRGQYSSEHTQVLDILVKDQGRSTGLQLGTGLGTGAQGLVDDDAICDGSGDEGQAVGELGGAGVVIHSDPREGVADNRQDKRQVSVRQLLAFKSPSSPFSRQDNAHCGRQASLSPP